MAWLPTTRGYSVFVASRLPCGSVGPLVAEGHVSASVLDRRCRSSIRRICSGSGSDTTRPGFQRTKLPARQQSTSQPFGRGAAQLALDQDLVVVALIDLGEPDAELEAGGLDQGAQPFEARYHLIAFVAADQGGRDSAPAAQFRL